MNLSFDNVFCSELTTVFPWKNFVGTDQRKGKFAACIQVKGIFFWVGGGLAMGKM